MGQELKDSPSETWRLNILIGDRSYLLIIAGLVESEISTLETTHPFFLQFSIFKVDDCRAVRGKVSGWCTGTSPRSPRSGLL